jgi:hypothetical protein
MRTYIATGTNGARGLFTARLTTLDPVDSRAWLHLRSFVGAEALFAVEAVDEGIGEAG